MCRGRDSMTGVPSSHVCVRVRVYRGVRLCVCSCVRLHMHVAMCGCVCAIVWLCVCLCVRLCVQLCVRDPSRVCATACVPREFTVLQGGPA